MSREYSLPATTREAVWTGAPPGRAPGQITLTVRDASDNTLFLAATNAVETSVPGTYRVTYTTPQVAGLLLETWTDTVPAPDTVRTYELEITSNAPQSPIFTPPTGQYVRSFFFNMPESTIAFVRATMQEAAVTADLTLPGSWASIELFDPLPAPETDGSYELTTDNAVLDPTAYYRIAWETALGAVFNSDAVLFPGSATGLDKFRLELGDTDSTAPLFNDDEAGYFIARRPGNVLLAVADACDALATRFASDFDFEWQGSTDARGRFNRSQMSKMYADRAKVLRERAGGLPLGLFPEPWSLEF